MCGKRSVRKSSKVMATEILRGTKTEDALGEILFTE